MTTPETPRPWWASLFTSALTTIIGVALILVSVCLLRPALAPDGDGWWGSLFVLGLGFASAGGSLLGVNVARGGTPDQRGQVDVQALGAVAGVAFALLLLIVAALSTSGCGSTYQAERRAVVDWTASPKCHIEVHLDDDPKAVVTVDAPEACEPPPDLCQIPQSRADELPRGLASASGNRGAGPTTRAAPPAMSAAVMKGAHESPPEPPSTSPDQDHP